MGGNTRFIVGGLAAALVVAVVVIIVLVFTGGGEDVKEVRAPAPTTTPTQAATPVPTQAPTQVPTQPPPPPTQPPPQALPDRTDCNQIRGTEYRSDAEKAWFEANCRTAATAPTAAPRAAPTATGGAPPPPAAADGEVVRSYRSRAEATINQYNTQLAQFMGTPTYGAINDILQLGSIADNYANALGGITPVPPLFQAAHSQLISALLSFRDGCRAVQGITSLPQFNAWWSQMLQRASAVDAAIANLAAVAGIRVQTIGGFR